MREGMTKQLFKFKEVPSDWALCFRNECPFHDNCQRWLAGSYAPRTVVLRTCVTPHAVNAEKPCKYYVKPEPILMARGFGDIFKDVKRSDYNEMKAKLINYLGSERTYYYYKKGDKLLSPKQQEWIRQLFERYGYGDYVQFTELDDIYLFPHARP